MCGTFSKLANCGVSDDQLHCETALFSYIHMSSECVRYIEESLPNVAVTISRLPHVVVLQYGVISHDMLSCSVTISTCFSSRAPHQMSSQWIPPLADLSVY